MKTGTATVVKAAFFDELEKIAVSRHRMRVAQSRKGRRPMRVDTMLKKEKEGTLYKHALSVPFSTGPFDPGEARRPTRRGDAPSNDDTDLVGRRDQLGAATPSGRAYNGAVNTPKTAGVFGTIRQGIKQPGALRDHMMEVGGLGVLAAPGLDTLQAHARARLAGDKSPQAVEKRQLLGEGGHAALDVAGLGALAAPELKHLRHP